MKRGLLILAIWAAGPALAEEVISGTDVPRPVVSEIITAIPQNVTSFIGVVDARVTTDLGFPVIGTIAERPVELGDQVSKGDVLARLDPQDMDAELRAAEAGVTVAQAQLRSASDAASRASQLVERGVESETRLEDAERALKAAEARMEQAEATLTRARDVRSYAELKAPQDGVITGIYAEPGATLSTGEPVVRLVGTDRREAVIDMTEQDLAALEANSSFNIALIANPDIVARATLSRIDPVANRTTRTRRVRLALSEPPESFRLGALVRILPETGFSAGIHIPKTAVLQPDSGTPTVWVVDRSDNSVRRVDVSLGEEFGPRIRITDGLSLGDEVILKGIHSLHDGQIVGRQVTQ